MQGRHVGFLSASWAINTLDLRRMMAETNDATPEPPATPDAPAPPCSGPHGGGARRRHTGGRQKGSPVKGGPKTGRPYSPNWGSAEQLAQKTSGEDRMRWLEAALAAFRQALEALNPHHQPTHVGGEVGLAGYCFRKEASVVVQKGDAL